MITRNKQSGFTGIEVGCLVLIIFVVFLILVEGCRANQPSVIDVVTSQRSTEDAGTEDKIIDNTGSAEPMTYYLNVENRWRNEYTIQEGALRKATRRLGIAHAPLVAEMGASIQKELSVSISERKETQRKDVLELEVPARKRLHICLIWRNIWQEGFVKVKLNSREQIDVPFKVLEERRFDYRTSKCKE